MNVEINDGKNSYLQEKHVFNGFGCSGGNLIPEISWSDIPAAIFKGISADNYADVVKSGAIESITSFGQAGYGGPCPPEGYTPHRYVFKVYALENKLDANPAAQPGLMGFQLNAQAISTATSTLLYGR